MSDAKTFAVGDLVTLREEFGLGSKPWRVIEEANSEGWLRLERGPMMWYAHVDNAEHAGPDAVAPAAFPSFTTRVS
jgi:hypothetical protein